MIKLSAKLMDIDYRGVMINREDSRKLGVLDGDRIQIINQERGVSVQAVVTTTETIIPEGTVGIFYITNKRLDAKEGEIFEIRIADRHQ
jgi:AMP phosphorylase